MLDIHNLPRNWAIASVGHARQQKFLPDSPVRVTDAEVVLCAAACIAYAGLGLESPTEQQDFLSGLVTTQNKGLVVAAFQRLGLSEKACHEAMTLNDETPFEKRIEVLAALLNV